MGAVSVRLKLWFVGSGATKTAAMVHAAGTMAAWEETQVPARPPPAHFELPHDQLPHSCVPTYDAIQTSSEAVSVPSRSLSIASGRASEYSAKTLTTSQCEEAWGIDYSPSEVARGFFVKHSTGRLAKITVSAIEGSIGEPPAMPTQADVESNIFIFVSCNVKESDARSWLSAYARIVRKIGDEVDRPCIVAFRQRQGAKSTERKKQFSSPQSPLMASEDDVLHTFFEGLRRPNGHGIPCEVIVDLKAINDVMAVIELIVRKASDNILSTRRMSRKLSIQLLKQKGWLRCCSCFSKESSLYGVVY